MDRLPRTGEFYKDLSDKTYQIVAIAAYAETGEQMIVYQALFGDFGVYTQPVQRFTANFTNQNETEAFREQRRQKTAGELRDQQNTVGFLRNLQNPAGSYGNSQNPADNYGNGQNPAGSYENSQNPADGFLHPQDLANVSVSGQKDTDAVGHPSGPDEVLQNHAETRQLQQKPRPRTQSPAEARRILRQNQSGTNVSAADSYYDEKRRRQMEEREQRREMFRKSERHESATEELRANPCLLKFLEADTYEEKFHVLNTIQNDMTDRLIDDIAVVLDVVIPEGPLNDRFYQLRNIILTRQKYETNRFR